MKANFYLKNGNRETSGINAQIYYCGKRYVTTPQEVIITSYWDKERQECKKSKRYTEGVLINERLKEFKKVMIKTIQSFNIRDTVPTQDEFRERLKLNLSAESFKPYKYIADWAVDWVPKSRRHDRTMKSYVTTINLLRKYEKIRGGRLTFDDIDMAFYRSFQDFMNSKDYSINYFGTQIKNIKVFMNEAMEKGLHKNSKHLGSRFQSPSENSDSVYLSSEELLKIFDLQLTPELIKLKYPNISRSNMLRKIESMKYCRDRFLIGAYTGLRISDFSRLKTQNISNGTIRIIPLKGRSQRKNREVVIPMHWIVKEIITNGYDFDKKVSGQKFNQAIKEVCKLAEINDFVISSRTEGGKVVEYTKPKYDMVSSHTARRSAATNMFLEGIEPIYIMRITGHRTERAFMKYIKVTEEQNANILAQHPFFNKK